MKKKNTLILVVIAAAMLQTGCASYSFRGTHSGDSSVKVSGTQQYRLNQYSADIPSSVTPWSVVRFAGKNTSKRDIERDLLSSYSNRFTRAENAVPVDVTVRCVESKCNAWGLATYLLSLGIYPANVVRYEDQCEVIVSVNGDTQRGTVKFRSNSWLSVWTPFGKNRTDSQDEYSGTYRHGGGIMVAPHLNTQCANGQKETYIAEVAAEINANISKLEQTAVVAETTAAIVR